MLDLLITLVLAAHLLSVNLGSTGPLACVWLRRRAARRGDALADVLARRLAGASLVATTLGLVLGGVLVAIMLRRDAFAAAAGQVVASKWWSAGAEVVFYYVCLGAYWMFWRRLSTRRYLHPALAVMAATDMIYHFPPLWTIVAVAARRSEWASVVIDSNRYRHLLVDPEVASRVVHSWLAGAAVTGVAVMVLAVTSGRRRGEEAAASPIVTAGGWIALIATTLQMAAGVCVLLALPATARDPLLGGDSVGTALFAAALLATFLLLHVLAPIAWGEPQEGRVKRSLALTVIIVVLMTGALLRTRSRRSAAAGISSRAEKVTISGLFAGTLSPGKIAD